MYNSEFATYLANKTGINTIILNQLFKKHFNAFDVALILIETFGIDKEKLGRIWGDYLGFAYVDPNKSIVDKEYIEKVGINFIEMNKVLPLYKLGKAVTFCTSNPTNPSIVEHTERKVGEPVSLVFCFPFDIKTYLKSNNIKSVCNNEYKK